MKPRAEIRSFKNLTIQNKKIMSKTNFDNSFNIDKALRKGGFIANIMFLFSVLTTALALSVITLSVFWGGYEQAPEWAVYTIGGAGLLIGILLDFWGVKPFALAMLTEWIALITGRFAFTWLRAFSAVSFAVIFGFLFFVSFMTSRQGAAILGATSAPKISVSETTDSAAQKIASIRETRTASYDAEIERLEAERDALVAAVLSPYEQKKLAKGNADQKRYFQAELDRRAAPIREQYAARIESEQSARAEALASIGTLEKTIMASAQAKNEQQVQAATAMQSGIVGVVMNFGAYSIIVGLALLFVRAIMEVEGQLPARAPSSSFVGNFRQTVGGLFNNSTNTRNGSTRRKKKARNGAPVNASGGGSGLF